jgi:G3E family GTPase
MKATTYEWSSEGMVKIVQGQEGDYVSVDLYEQLEQKSDETYNHSVKILNEMTDRVEQLEAERSEAVASSINRGMRIVELEAERNALNKALGTMTSDHCDMKIKYHASLDLVAGLEQERKKWFDEAMKISRLHCELQREINRCREALEELVDWQNGPPLSTDRWVTGWNHAMELARAALGGDKP